MDFVETTPGVYQASGYGDLTSNESIWFWFFAARNNPDTAPLITWFNGGVRKLFFRLDAFSSAAHRLVASSAGKLEYAWPVPRARAVPYQQRQQQRLVESLWMERECECVSC